MFCFALQSTYPVPAVKVVATAVGVAGIVLVSVSGIGLAANSTGHCQWQDAVQPTVSKNTSNNSTPRIIYTGKWHCTPFTHVELTTSLFALIGGSLMWAISSGM